MSYTRVDTTEVCVVNKYKEPNHEYIGRGTPLGNPYTHLDKNTLAQFKVNTRDEACEAYAIWFDANKDKPVQKQMLDRLLSKLRTQGYINLGCFCSPQRCHGETIKKYLEEQL